MVELDDEVEVQPRTNHLSLYNCWVTLQPVDPLPRAPCRAQWRSDELRAPEGEGVGCVESSAVIDLECVAVEDVGESATLMVDAANAVDPIPDGICGKDICVVTSDDEVLSLF